MEQPRNRTITSEVFVFHIDSQITAAGRPRLSRLVIDRAVRCGRQLGVELLGDDHAVVGAPLS